MDGKTKNEGLLFKQSSELEILISAAIVFAAFQIHDMVPQLLATLINHNISNASFILVYVAIIALFLGTLLPISIVAHFIIRFYWLSLVGLRTAFENTKSRKHLFDPRYTKKPLDNLFIDIHIEQVDKICSSIFAFSFLVIFAFCLSMVPVLFIITILEYAVELFRGTFLYYVIGVLLLLFLFICILTLVDFCTMGAFKRIKNKWFVKIYYPISKFMSVITFSFFYRGIYHTFLQKVSRKVFIIALPTYIFLAIILSNLGYYDSRFYANDPTAFLLGKNGITNPFYAENFNEATVIPGPFIPSFRIKEDFLEISIPLTDKIDAALAESCEDVVQINKRGFHWRRWITTSFNKRSLPSKFDFAENAEKVLSCFSEKIDITLDSTEYKNLHFMFREIKIPERSVLTTFVDIEGMSRGEHTLTVNAQRLDSTDISLTIPFLKE